MPQSNCIAEITIIFGNVLFSYGFLRNIPLLYCGSVHERQQKLNTSESRLVDLWMHIYCVPNVKPSGFEGLECAAAVDSASDFVWHNSNGMRSWSPRSNVDCIREALPFVPLLLSCLTPSALRLVDCHSVCYSALPHISPLRAALCTARAKIQFAEQSMQRPKPNW